MITEAPRVLLADDEETFRRSTARLWSKRGIIAIAPKTRRKQVRS